LAEENATDLRKSFDIAVGNLPDKKSCTVKISYAQELSHLGTSLVFALPVTGAFGASASISTSLVPPDVDQTPTTPRNESGELDGFSFNATINMGSAIKSLDAEGCDVHIDGKTATVGAKGLSYPGHRVELVVAVDDPYTSAAVVEEFPGNPKNKAIMLSLFPKVETEIDSVTEMIFLVDRSGSMGSKIGQVRNAMQLFLRSIPMGTRFNIVGFGSDFVKLFDEAQPFDDKVMAKAVEHVSGMGANLGGTELYRPLSFVMSQPVDPKYPRQIFVLTDGAVSNAGIVLDYVRDNIGLATRIFTLGIGSGASQVLVQGIAHLGNGMAQQVDNYSRLERPIMALVNRALTPIIVDVEPYWGDYVVLDRPIARYTKPVFDGQKLVAYDFLDSSVPQPDAGKVVVKMIATTSAGEKIEYKSSVDASKDVVSGSAIHRLAAMSIIRDLETAENLEEATTGKPNTKKDDIVTRALEYSLASKHTSFVAVEERDEPVLDAMEKVDVSKQLGEENMDVIENKRVGAPPTIEAAPDDAEPASSSAARKDKKSEEEAPKREMKKKSMAAPSVSMRRSSAPMVNQVESIVYRVVLLAHADGSFELGDSLYSALSLTRESIDAATPDPLKKKLQDVWATLLVLAFMELKCPLDKEEWGLLYKKSTKWIVAQLAKNTKVALKFEDLLAAAKTLFS
jgi:hypothetical protein